MGVLSPSRGLYEEVASEARYRGLKALWLPIAGFHPSPSGLRELERLASEGFHALGVTSPRAARVLRLYPDSPLSLFKRVYAVGPWTARELGLPASVPRVYGVREMLELAASEGEARIALARGVQAPPAPDVPWLMIAEARVYDAVPRRRVLEEAWRLSPEILVVTSRWLGELYCSGAERRPELIVAIGPEAARGAVGACSESRIVVAARRDRRGLAKALSIALA